MTSTALLIMDVQQGIVARFGESGEYLSRLAAAVGAARDAGIGVIYVTVYRRRTATGSLLSTCSKPGCSVLFCCLLWGGGS